MPRKAQDSYPAQLWYDAHCVLGGSRAKNPLYAKHDAHVRVWKSWARLRAYQPHRDHDAHVNAWEQRCKSILARNVSRVDGPLEDRCAVWTAAIGKSHRQPFFRIGDFGVTLNAITMYQRIHMSVSLGRGLVWGEGECGNPHCVRHRTQITRGALNSAIQHGMYENAHLKAQRVAVNRRLSYMDEDKVKRIHEMRAQGISCREIAEALSTPDRKVSKSTVACIGNGRRWAGVGKSESRSFGLMASQLMGVSA